MALVHVLGQLQAELGVQVTVVSVDHGLRPEAAAEVEAVGELARTLQLPFVGKRVHVKVGPSTQGQAREARYEALHEVARERHAQLIAVGHHRDDQAETLLFRLLRGAPLAGLAGIEARRSDGVIRPLLDCAREAIVRHLEKHGLPFIEDPSNQQTAFLRARIRHGLLPALEQENPALREYLAALADEVAGWAKGQQPDAAALLQRAAVHRTETDEEAPWRLRARMLAQADPVLQRVALRDWIRHVTGKDPGQRKLDALAHGLSIGRGEVPIDAKWTARVERDTLALSTAPREPIRGN